MKLADPQAGLTLVEVLVALAILGMVAVSVLTLIAQNARFMASAEDQALASVAADNLIVEALAARAPLERGTASGEIAVGNRTLLFNRDIVEIGIDGVVRIDIAVRAASGGQVVAKASTFKREKP